MKTKQQGFTFISFLITAIIVIFLCLGLFRSLPVYIEHMNVSGSFSALENKFSKENTERKPLKKTVIRQTLQRLFDVNDITRVNAKAISIKKEKGKYIVTADYDIRVPFFANIDLVFHFNNRTELSSEK